MDECRADGRTTPIDLVAHIDLPGNDDVEVLVALNLSERGVFLAAGIAECAWLVPDTCFEVTVTTAEEGGADLRTPDLRVRARARVAWRVDDLSPAPGIGALFEDVAPADRESLRLFLSGPLP